MVLVLHQARWLLHHFCWCYTGGPPSTPLFIRERLHEGDPQPAQLRIESAIHHCCTGHVHWSQTVIYWNGSISSGLPVQQPHDMHFLLVLFIVCQFENQSGRTTDQAIHFLVLRDPRIPPQGREDRRHSQKYAPSTAVLWVFLVRLSLPTIYVNDYLYFGKIVLPCS